MYFGRFNKEESTRTQLPNEWTDQLVKVLHEAYANEVKAKNSLFDVYGEIYEDEFVVIASFMSHSDPASVPISVFISHDVISDEKNFKKSLKDLIDLFGLIFDDIFSTADWADYNSNWTENKFKGSQFYYKITRENISLTLQAEEILKKGDLV